MIYLLSISRGLGREGNGRVDPVDIVILPESVFVCWGCAPVCVGVCPSMCWECAPVCGGGVPQYVWGCAQCVGCTIDSHNVSCESSTECPNKPGLSLDACVELREKGKLKRVDDSKKKTSEKNTTTSSQQGPHQVCVCVCVCVCPCVCVFLCACVCVCVCVCVCLGECVYTYVYIVCATWNELQSLSVSCVLGCVCLSQLCSGHTSAGRDHNRVTTSCQGPEGIKYTGVFPCMCVCVCVCVCVYAILSHQALSLCWLDV